MEDSIITCSEKLPMLCSDEVSKDVADLRDVVWSSEVDPVHDDQCSKDDLEIVSGYPQKMHVSVPFVMLQLIRHLEPNHAMQINATSSLDEKLDVECIRDNNDVLITFDGIDFTSGNEASVAIRDITGPVLVSLLDDQPPSCDQFAMPSLSSGSVTNDVTLMDSSGCRHDDLVSGVESSLKLDVMESSTELENDSGLVAMSSSIGLLFPSETDQESLDVINMLSHAPRVAHDVAVFRCAMCSCLSFSLERAVHHAKRPHVYEGETPGVDIVPELLQTVYYCMICGSPSLDSYRWQTHMRRRHHITVDRRRRIGADPRIRERKRLVSLKDKSFAAIQCVACGRSMRLTESYYLHIRRAHRHDGFYSAALAHLEKVRASRRQRKSVTNISSVPCPLCGTMVSSVRHLLIAHGNDPFLDSAIAITKERLRTDGMHRRSARAAVRVECTQCGRRMRRVNLRTHLQYHCSMSEPSPGDLLESTESSSTQILSLEPPNIVDHEHCVMLLPSEVCLESNVDGACCLEPEESQSTAGDPPLSSSRPKPKMVTCKERLVPGGAVCGKVMTVKAYYTHRRKVHGKGIRKSPATYHCHFCDRKFWDQYHLRNHMMIHTREKVIVCLLCRRSFLQYIGYREHYDKIHLRRFLHTCDTCGRGFWKRVNKLHHRCKPENRDVNLRKNQVLELKAQQVLSSWKGPVYVEVNRCDVNKLAPPSPKHTTSSVPVKHILCLICNKVFTSMRYYQVHHKYSHLQQHDFTCDDCGLGFWSRSQLAVHHCLPARRDINTRKRQVLAARMVTKLRTIKKPYFAILNTDGTLDSADCSITADCLKNDSSDPSHDSIFHLSAKDLKTVDCAGSENGSDGKMKCEMSSDCGDVDELSAWSNELDDVSEDLQANILRKESSTNRNGLERSSDVSENEDEVGFGSLSRLVCEIGAADIEVNEAAGGDCRVEPVDPARTSIKVENVLTVPDTVGCMDGSGDGPVATIDDSMLSGVEMPNREIDPGETVQSSGGKQWPMATVLDAERLLCGMCQKEIRKSNYHPHMRRVHGVTGNAARPIIWKVCDRCGYRCTDNYKFRRHVMTHDRNESADAIVCELCGKQCYEQMDYTHHFKRRHLGQFNIQCDACGKGFWKTATLQQHACYPELRDENVRLQKEKERDALQRRDEIRAAMGPNVKQMSSVDSAAVGAALDKRKSQKMGNNSKGTSSVRDRTVQRGETLTLRDKFQLATSCKVSSAVTAVNHPPSLLNDQKTAENGLIKRRKVRLVVGSKKKSNASPDVPIVERVASVVSRNVVDVSQGKLADSVGPLQTVVSPPTHSYGTRRKKTSFREILN